jgi:hypothetical protein
MEIQEQLSGPIKTREKRHPNATSISRLAIERDTGYFRIRDTR